MCISIYLIMWKSNMKGFIFVFNIQFGGREVLAARLATLILSLRVPRYLNWALACLMVTISWTTYYRRCTTIDQRKEKGVAAPKAIILLSLPSPKEAWAVLLSDVPWEYKMGDGTTYVHNCTLLFVWLCFLDYISSACMDKALSGVAAGSLFFPWKLVSFLRFHVDNVAD